MKSKSVISLVLVAVIVINLAACGSVVEISSTPQPTATLAATAPPVLITQTPAQTTIPATPTVLSFIQIKQSWLQNNPCSPPCFENITAGKTTVSEALEILKKNPKIGKVLQKECNSTRGEISWDWATLPSDRQIGKGGLLEYEGVASNQIVYRISPKFGENNISLGEVIQAFGEPTHIVAESTIQETGGDSFSVYIIYLDKGLISGGIYYTKPSVKPLINQNLVLKDRLDLFEPGFAGLVKYTSFRQADLVPWQGFKDFDFYCKASQGNQCIYHS